MVLSRICRGTQEEKIELSFTVCDLNRNGYISREVILSSKK